ncbi:helix-turn-helix transcriptional regulator [Serratia fonticola]|uniref:helix-turn-helix domain-containing protein n=1 Tax=Serratia fonticola TaxID=47917 RepID=UPI00157559F2|nr:helix-turn-helix domain-containing protein [Serratia fonticola]NTY87808.1 helix-turn-helix transcriptional regulator [Serratia fonticola]NTZ13479.1 helix-turn-helix transcriptional regulator [Serratia fonticola]
MSTTLGKKIREVRDSEGLTREEFASLTGIPAGTQKHYEMGRRESIGSEILMKITQHPRFEKYALWLMTGKTSEAAGQISPILSPDGQGGISNRQNGQKVG